MNFAQLRDALLALDPLSKRHVVEINKAEADFWTRSQGSRMDWSDRLLGFECGGQQWVSEVAMPCGTIEQPSGSEIRFTRELLELIESSDIPAPAQIEQRWSARSQARMSPAYSMGADDLHSWVGIIMYMPSDDPTQRQAITDSFTNYNDAVRWKLWPKYGCHQHWAKVQLPTTGEADVVTAKRRLHERFPIGEFNATRAKLDPASIMTNQQLDNILEPP